MAAFLDGCRFNPTAGGTTDWTYSSAVTGYQSPAAAQAVNGAVYRYRAESADLSQWELGTTTYNSGTGVFARTNVLYNSSGTGSAQGGAGTKINFLTVPQVAIVALAEDLTIDNFSIHGADVAAAATLNLDTATGNFVHVTGNTTITAITLTDGRQRTVYFTGTPMLTNGASLVLPGAQNILVGAGDIAVFIADGTTVRCSDYFPAAQPAARALIGASPFDALAYNGIQLNGSADISQELGTTGATLASGTTKYIADSIQAQYVHAAGTAVVVSAQLAATSFPVALSGYVNGHQIKATTAISSPANGDYALHRWPVEGYRIARLGWGTANAQPLSYGFQFYAAASGTVFVKVSNSTYARCYYQEQAVSAGWNWLIGTIPGDTSGTWANGSGSVGLYFEVYASGKAASPAAPGSWGSTNTTQTTNSTNLLGTNGNQTIVTGLVIVPGIEFPQSSRAPFIMRPPSQELLFCQRHVAKSYPQGTNAGSLIGGGSAGFSGLGTQSGGSFAFLASIFSFPRTMMAVPSVFVWDNAGNSSKVSYYTGTWNNNGAASFGAVSDCAFLCGVNNISNCAGFSFGYMATARL